ncbi:AI-2E family transporter [Candidatus Hakubella thermalkaliphila]|nr:AI-2E family transporter [Candidatus Hakubella thermalkaliphila]
MKIMLFSREGGSGTEVPGEPMEREKLELIKRVGIISWSLIGIGVIVLAALYLVYFLRFAFTPLVLAILLAYILSPLVSYFERWVPRIYSTLIAYLIFLSVVAIILVFVIPVMVQQIRGFIEGLPFHLARAREIGAALGEQYLRMQLQLPPALENVVESAISEFQAFALSILRRAPVATISLISAIATFILAPIVAFYLLKDLKRIGAFFLEVFPESRRETVTSVISIINRAVGGFVRGQLTVALIVGIMCSLVLIILGVDYPILLGMIAGLFNVIPYLGPVVGAVPAAIIALLDSPIKALLVVVLFFVVQQIDNALISPNVMKHYVGVHPVVAIFSLIAGGVLFGLWGILLAVPLVAVAQELVLTFVLKKKGVEVKAAGALDGEGSKAEKKEKIVR